MRAIISRAASSYTWGTRKKRPEPAFLRVAAIEISPFQHAREKFLGEVLRLAGHQKYPMNRIAWGYRIRDISSRLPSIRTMHLFREWTPIRRIGSTLPTLLLVCALVYLPVLQAQSAPDFSPVVAQMRERIASGVPSIAIAVAWHGRIIWEHVEGMSDQEANIRATSHTPYYLASISKTITATALMELVERRKVDLDQPINRYLRAAKVVSPMFDASQATVRRVANHTAGLATYDRDCVEGDTNCDASPAAAIRRYGVIVWPPGRYFDYSNLDYGILGQIVAEVSGSDLGQSLRRTVFEPLQMKGCSLGAGTDRQNPPAVRYDQSPPFMRMPPRRSTSPGASGVYCSVEDLAAFGMFHLKDHLSSQKILSDQAIERMQANSLDSAQDTQYGLSWWVQQDLHGFHGVLAQGGTNDATAYLQLIPSEDIAVAMLWNTGTPDGAKFIDQVLALMLPRYRENLERPEAEPPPAAPVARPQMSEVLIGIWNGFVQTYRGRVPLQVTIDGAGGVTAQLGPNAAVQARPNFNGGALRWTMPGSLGVEGEPFRLAMRLYLYGNVLAGAARTSPSVPNPKGPWVYYWVKVDKNTTSAH